MRKSLISLPADVRRVYLVECEVPTPDGVERVVVDHHRPGDPGYGRPPSDFLPASSIGQVIAELARLGAPLPWAAAAWPRYISVRVGLQAITWSVGSRPMYVLGLPGDGYRTVDVGLLSSPDERSTRISTVRVPTVARLLSVPRDIVLCAAADHCLAAAYRGECPGVDPDELMRWRAETRAAHQGRSVEDILADVERARDALRRAPMIILGAHPDPDAPDLPDPYHPIAAVDMRGQHVPELPEASAREGLCFVADGLPGPDGLVKVVCQSGRPDQIEAFMQTWAPAQGLTGIYGDPARGFAGGYRETA